jgi:hypothetical protein
VKPCRKQENQERNNAMKQRMELVKGTGTASKAKERGLLVVALLALCAATISAVMCTGRPGAAKTLRAAQSGDVQITLRADGFTPSEVTHAAGSFTLTVVNESGSQSLNLRLVRENGELVREMSITSGQQQWSGAVELPSGGYYLTEANHAAWLFHIVVQ